MKQYRDLLKRVLDHGSTRMDRTGAGTVSVFGEQCRYDLRNGFPLVTTKRVNFDAIVRELLWFLSGSTNIRELSKYTPIWNAWADDRGDLGPVYGYQWRHWGGDQEEFGNGVDQISEALKRLKRYPHSRRHIVSSWNVNDVPRMALPPCHMMFQFFVEHGHLDLQMYQRSADLALGVPYNIASYALLLSMFAMECRLVPRYFIHVMGDAHIYLNHVDGVRLQLERAPRPLPTLVIADLPVLEQRFEDIKLIDYDPHPFIKFEVAV